jgi:hypothetical protein
MAGLPFLARIQSLEIYHEESINNNIEVQRWEFIAWILVVPEADLHGSQNSCVHEEKGVCYQHHCAANTSVRPGAE